MSQRASAKGLGLAKSQLDINECSFDKWGLLLNKGCLFTSYTMLVLLWIKV